MGYTLRDPHRWMEDWKGFGLGSLDAHPARTRRRALDEMPGHDALLRRIGVLTGELPIALRIHRAGTATIVVFRPSGASVPRLYVVDRARAEKRLFVDPETAAVVGDAQWADFLVFTLAQRQLWPIHKSRRTQALMCRMH
ncbi:hypothetical protein K7957_18700 [Sphingomonas yunnanensis]|uniref:hypothetical protein n=1 Tax=Sphingomonas yunnanensis TaxID=310400 RepID=UPI001CA6ABA7|nr:hypothetical protein [Sphingomonas yunnanensis]MBY9064969.1 hypothetical protein [Sphingomonas yunnanensis]